MKPLFVLAFIFVTAIAFAQNTPTAELGCQQIVRLEATVGELLVKYTEKHPQVVRLREEIEAQRTELQKDSPGYVCRSQLQGAGIVAPRANVTQPNIPQPNGHSFACAQFQAATERVREQRERVSEQIMRLRETEQHPEQHPDMQALSVSLASAEVALAEARTRAASQGLNCSATYSNLGEGRTSRR